MRVNAVVGLICFCVVAVHCSEESTKTSDGVWVPQVHENGDVFYHDAEQNVSVWDHPHIEWHAAISEEHEHQGSLYYYNKNTNESKWDFPADDVTWIETLAEDGRVYYFNHKTNESHWFLPKDARGILSTRSVPRDKLNYRDEM
eukprot:TRINITY_DN88518_c0_g1_i1.p1 TRINITY_DN88518_c0_g1~~TRINITY_DN88518_c0_g1_i1.p1  ORF type:complete len:144 (+),score=11.24 TRINITY_DN88518_c0_g1_i1:44-475(+)